MALEKLSPSGAPILPRMLYGQESGETEHIILVDADGKVVEASSAGILAKLDINLSRAALGANVAQNKAEGLYGLNYDFLSSGTAVPANTENTILDVSGFGKLHYVLFLNDLANTLLQVRILLDGVSLFGSLSNAYLMQSIHDSALANPSKLCNAVNYDTGNNDYALEINTSLLGGGAFGSSCFVGVKNYDVGNPHNGLCTAWYLTSASEKFSITNPAVKDTAAIRKDLAGTLSLDEEAVTAVYQVNWDEDTKKNVPSLSVIVHSALSGAGKAAVSTFLNERRTA